MSILTPSPHARLGLSRRALLQQLCLGFGGLAFNASMAANPLQPHVPPFRARAKRVIFLFMHGGPSHIDLFDYKPRLFADHDKPLPFKERSVQFASRGNIMRPLWDFRQVGASGLWMSKLWQHLPRVADELCMVHSMCETNVSHGGACMHLHCGHEAFVRPSMGSWISYGLGSENQNLPAFITICPTSLHGGVNNYGSSFLPAVHQGVPLGTPGYPNTSAKDAKFNYIASPNSNPVQQRLQLDLLRRLHEKDIATAGMDPNLEARIQSFELAFRMQTAAPEATDLREETPATRALYGMDEPETQNFGHMCLLARRFAERDVRFIQVSHAGSLKFNNEQWDQHSHLEKGHSINVKQIDKPISGLIQDLKARGLLEDTLVVWSGEFGRTPTVQSGEGPKGRDHHPDGFTLWMAGGGIKPGFRYGATDEFGYHAVEDRCTIHDLHATILHLLGLDHTRLTYAHAGRDYRLTDVFGNVAHKILV